MPLRCRRFLVAAAAGLGAIGAAPPAARAQESAAGPVVFGADQVRFDPTARSLEATGHVHVDEPPFHLTSDALQLRRVPIGVELHGRGVVAFCPCLGTPLSVRFDAATVAPPHDLVLRNPVLEIFGVPIAWAPVMWLRSADRSGLLPPDVAWRGADGFFAGGGVHVPWRYGDASHGIDVRAGGYARGGVDVQVALKTDRSASTVGWDRLRGDDGVRLSLIGAVDDRHAGAGVQSLTWAVDALRGARAVRAVTDVDAAARPFDHAEAQAAWRSGGWTFASGLRTAAVRGGDAGDLGAFGPVFAARRSDAIGSMGAYDATFEGGEVSEPALGSTSFARAEGGALVAARAGPLGGSVDARAAGEAADDGSRRAVDGTAQLRASVGMPLERAYASSDEDDPWVHRTEPRVDAAILLTRTGGVLVAPFARGAQPVDGAASIAALGWYNSFARSGSRASALVEASGGVVVGGTASGAMPGAMSGAVSPALLARAEAHAAWAEVQARVARVFASSLAGPTGARFAGGASLAHARIGERTSLELEAHVAERDGVDPVVARALVDAPLEPADGFLDAPGWTGGAALGVPLGRRVRARAGADVDIDARRLVAALGSIEVHDPCGCVSLRASAAERIGRDGVDVWLSIDVSGR